MNATRVILSADGLLAELTEILSFTRDRSATNEIHLTRNAIVDKMIHACVDMNDNSHIEPYSRMMTSWFNTERGNPYVYTVDSAGSIRVDPPPKRTSRSMATVIYLLGNTLFRQMKELNMYDDGGRLMYCFAPINDINFNDVAMDYVHRLKWNGALYESTATPGATPGCGVRY